MANKRKKMNEATKKQVDWQDEGKSDKYEGHWLANNACVKNYVMANHKKTQMCGATKNPMMDDGAGFE